MLKHWLIDLVGHVSGLSDAQLRQIEKSLPASKALIDLLNRAQPIIEQAHKLYAEAEPLIDEAMKELQTVGPAAQILIDVIGHHVKKGSSPAEAAEAVRTALNGSIKSVAQDHWIDQRMMRMAADPRATSRIPPASAAPLAQPRTRSTIRRLTGRNPPPPKRLTGTIITAMMETAAWPSSGSRHISCTSGNKAMAIAP
jgi:hypothetical protein